MTEERARPPGLQGILTYITLLWPIAGAGEQEKLRLVREREFRGVRVHVQKQLRVRFASDQWGLWSHRGLLWD